MDVSSLDPSQVSQREPLFVSPARQSSLFTEVKVDI